MKKGFLIIALLSFRRGIIVRVARSISLTEVISE